MNYRPHPFLTALFVTIFLFNSFSVCLYGILVGKRGVTAYEVVHLIMSSISISAIFLFGIYLQYTRHRTKPFKLPYTVTFATISLASLVGSIIVSLRASQDALCSVFSSFPSNQDCKWGGVSIILPWVSAICGAGGLVCIAAEKQIGPVELLHKGAREDLERLQREWLKGCYEENLKRGSHSIDSERDELELEQDEFEHEEPEAGPSGHGFDPYMLANVAYPESIYASRQSIPTDPWRYDPGPILPRRYTTLSEEVIDEEEEEDFYAEEYQCIEPRIDVQYYDGYSDTVSQPDTDELNDVLDIRSLVYFPPNHPSMEDVQSATANLSDLNSHLLGRLTPSERGSPESSVEETSCWEDDDGTEEEEVAPKRKKKLRPRRVDSGSVRPPKNFVVRFEDPPSTREPSSPPPAREPSTPSPTQGPLTIIVTPPTPLPNRGFF